MAGFGPINLWDNINFSAFKQDPLEIREQGFSNNDVDVISSNDEFNNFVDLDSPESSVASVSSYMQNHPGATYEEVMQYMASKSDEWAEKYLDYLGEQEGIAEANRYTAEREDSAYQRLVEDMRRAGLNPAMMYGSSASPSASSSAGYSRLSEGANQRTIGNYSKLKSLLIAMATYQLNLGTGISGQFNNFLRSILSLIN